MLNRHVNSQIARAGVTPVSLSFSGSTAKVPESEGAREFPHSLEPAMPEKVSTAIWFGIPAGRHTLAGGYFAPQCLSSSFDGTGAGNRAGGLR